MKSKLRSSFGSLRFTVPICILLLSSLFISGCGELSGSSSSSGSGLSVNVITIYGPVRGFEASTDTLGWRGIPYAAAPVGELRWKPPVAPDSWTEVRDAGEDDWGDQAAQYPSYEPFGKGGMSEDCLYLNITAPKNAADLPVMVWFHGGAFTILTGNSESYNNPESLPTKGVVLVTVNHRLGPFGYMAHPLLSTEAQEESGYNGSGNYGQLDLIAALEWIQDNIEFFGGNPDNVTLFGQSGGGGKALSLMASPLATGLFHKVICQSGMAPFNNSVLNGTDLTAAHTKGEDLFGQLGVTSLADARALSWREIMAAVDLLYPPIGFNHDISTYVPNVDNHYMTDTMDSLIESAMVSDVPMIVGANAADLVLGIDLAPGVSEQMPARSANSNATHYIYKWSHVPAGWAAAGVEAYHGIELVYVFNDPINFLAHYFLDLTGLDVDYTKTAEQIVAETGYGAEDMILTDTIMTIWTNFAKTGDPNITGGTDWTPYDATGEAYLEIETGGTLTLKSGLDIAFPPVPE